jgi:peroxiredoxin
LLARTLLLSLLLAGLVCAQDDATDFQDRLAKVLDRYNDDPMYTGRRLEAAIDLCKKEVEAHPDDAQAQLELARFLLARMGRDEKDPGSAATAAAERAATLSKAQPERLKEAQAVQFLAFQLVETRRQQDQARVDEYKKKFVELYKKLCDVAGSKDAADHLVKVEQERLEQAAVLNDLGQVLKLEYEEVPPGAKDKKTIDRLDVDGNVVHLDAFLGKVVIVDFWKADNERYKKEIASTVAVYKKYAPKVEVIGISLDTDRAALDAFVKDNGVPWRQIFSGKGTNDGTARAWGVPFIKRYVLDQTGKVRFVNVRGDGLAAAVKQLVERGEKKK